MASERVPFSLTIWDLCERCELNHCKRESLTSKFWILAKSNGRWHESRALKKLQSCNLCEKDLLINSLNIRRLIWEIYWRSESPSLSATALSNIFGRELKLEIFLQLSTNFCHLILWIDWMNVTFIYQEILQMAMTNWKSVGYSYWMMVHNTRKSK